MRNFLLNIFIFHQVRELKIKRIQNKLKSVSNSRYSCGIYYFSVIKTILYLNQIIIFFSALSKEPHIIEVPEEMDFDGFIHQSLNVGESINKTKPVSVSTLTDEQRFKIHQNKQNAIQKRILRKNQAVPPKKPLTDEQRTRMEANRKKAVLKRSQIENKTPLNPPKKFKFRPLSCPETFEVKSPTSKIDKSLEDLCEESEASWNSNPRWEELGESQKRKHKHEGN